MKLQQPTQGSAQYQEQEEVSEDQPLGGQYEVKSAAPISSQPSLFGSALIEQIATKVTEKMKKEVIPGVLEELTLEHQAMEDKLLKRLVAAFNDSIVLSVRYCGLHVFQCYDSVVNIIKSLESQLDNLEDLLILGHIPERREPSDHGTLHSSINLTHSPQTTTILSPQPPIPQTQTHPSPDKTIPSSPKPSSPQIAIPPQEPSPTLAYQITPQQPSPISFTPRPDPSYTYARKGKAKVISCTIPLYSLFDANKKGESSATQEKAIEVAAILSFILSKAQLQVLKVQKEVSPDDTLSQILQRS